MEEKLDQFWRAGWDIHPELALGIAGLLSFYLVAVLVVGPRRQQRTAVGQIISFLAGIAVLLFTLGSPLHHLADLYLFSAHMIQHQLLTLIVPPLLLLGTPSWLVAPLLDRTWIARLTHGPRYPLLAFAIFNVPFAFIHFPAIYDAVFSNDISHRIVHVGFLATGLITWLPLASPAPSRIPRLSMPARLLYCFAKAILGSLVGSLLTLSDRLLYRHYGIRALELGINPLDDQQLGGLLMWVVEGTFWLGMLTVIFFVWADREEGTAYGQRGPG